MVVVFPLVGDLLTTFVDISGSWENLQDRSEHRADTRINGTNPQPVVPLAMPEITLAKEGERAKFVHPYT